MSDDPKPKDDFAIGYMKGQMFGLGGILGSDNPEAAALGAFHKKDAEEAARAKQWTQSGAQSSSPPSDVIFEFTGNDIIDYFLNLIIYLAIFAVIIGIIIWA